jgi:hypothetical protein
LDKVCTKLVVKTKMRYCPDPETAIPNSSKSKEINLVDPDSDDDPQPRGGNEAPKDDGFDLT